MCWHDAIQYAPSLTESMSIRLSPMRTYWLWLLSQVCLQMCVMTTAAADRIYTPPSACGLSNVFLTSSSSPGSCISLCNSMACKPTQTSQQQARRYGIFGYFLDFWIFQLFFNFFAFSKINVNWFLNFKKIPCFQLVQLMLIWFVLFKHPAGRPWIVKRFL